MKFILHTPNDDEREVYITGNFNDWNPQDPHFKMTQLEEGKYEIEIEDTKLNEPLEYKFTKGGWHNGEIDQYGNITKNRKNSVQGEVEDTVEKWRNNWGPFKQEFMPSKQLISESFYIPQLDKTRKIWALLPYDYYISEKKYPVLYLQDAQNLFDEGSQYGNWEIDKKLSILAEYGRGDVIVIAIEHGDEDRIKEYVFGSNSITPEGEGKKYIRFVTDYLKPYIDQHFRTLPDRENTGIGGSSLGGLISIYGGLLYPEVYSKLLIFSPSLWVVPHINFPMLQFYNPFKTKIYIYGGEKEGAKMTERIHEFARKLETWENHNIDFEEKVSINPEGTHKEYYWSQEFPKAIEWLYFDSKKDPVEIAYNSKKESNETT